jgi:hypothetical protein
MKRWILSFIPLCLAFMGLVACSNLDDYRRSYNVTYEDREGQRVSVGMTLEKRQALALTQAMVQQEARLPMGKVVGVAEDAAPVPMHDAALSLVRLTKEGDEGRAVPAVRPVMWAPPSPSDTMVYLTKGGKLRLETDAEHARMYRAAGWVDAPLPMWDPEVHHAPVWRGGRWVVPKMKNNQQ